MRVLILYTELADYVLKCCEQLSESAELHIVRWPVNTEAPFEFTFSNNLKIYERKRYNTDELRSLAKEIKPDIIICSGWIDKGYLKVVADFKGKIATVMSIDTQWRGDFKQHIASVVSRFTLVPKFSHAWVPGDSQERYAKNLGFKRIRKGFYSCDLRRFNQGYSIEQVQKRAQEKRFLYVGRYYDFKGIEDLWTAFSEFSAETKSDWELWCLGTGTTAPIQHPKIKHFGFVQPKDLAPIIDRCTAFVLPSRYEPWAVVVQEYAAAGFPMIVSDKVGAREAFVVENSNGSIFEAGNIAALKQALKNMAALDEKALISMSEQSHALAQKISPGTWAQTVIDIYNEYSRK
jgi:glycosyltransferase involved in cell wall biosynthesis